MSLNLFYLHSSDSIGNIALIEELIGNEVLSNRALNKHNKTLPSLQTTVYGVYDQTKKKYCRVRLLSKVMVVPVFNAVDAMKREKDELYIAFYIGKFFGSVYWLIF